MSAEENQALSQRIIQRFLRTAALKPEQWKGMRVGLYQALPSELSLVELERHLIRHQACLFFPRILKPRQAPEIEFVEIGADQVLSGEMAHQAWRSGPYGIQEPHSDLPAVDPAVLDLIVVPGVAFGHQGERLGMGAGYYDRFLARVPDLVRVVLAFEFQLLERLEQKPWDQSVDWILTEQDEIRNDRARKWLQSRSSLE